MAIVTLKPVTYNVADAKELLEYRLLGPVEQLDNKLEEFESYSSLGHVGEIMELLENAYDFQFCDDDMIEAIIADTVPGRWVCTRPDELVAVYCNGAMLYSKQFDNSIMSAINWLNSFK